MSCVEGNELSRLNKIVFAPVNFNLIQPIKNRNNLISNTFTISIKNITDIINRRHLNTVTHTLPNCFIYISGAPHTTTS